MTENPKKKKVSKLRVYVDIFFFALMILVLVPQSTGVPIHEWASFIILIPFLIHLIINWNWITSNSTKFFKRQPNKTRFDYVFNWILYLFMITVTVSGIVISESALPTLGIYFEPDTFWSLIHDLSATLFMVLLGIHLALHWRWVVGSLRKFNFKNDFHHLTELRTVIAKYPSQLSLLVFISIVFSLLIWLLEYSEWANGLRMNSGTSTEEGSKGMPNNWLIYVLPLIKVTVLMTVPALVTGVVIRIKKKIKG